VAAIDFHALGQVIWVAIVAGVGVTVLYSIVIYSADKAGDARREGEEGAALAFGALAAAALIVFLGVTVLGVIVMLRKA
jgi:heme/copper-type cytochrome/quinol oxidase subunit 2